MSHFRCRGLSGTCSFRDGKPCLKDGCEAFLWDGILVTEDERKGRWKPECVLCGSKEGLTQCRDVNTCVQCTRVVKGCDNHGVLRVDGERRQTNEVND